MERSGTTQVTHHNGNILYNNYVYVLTKLLFSSKISDEQQSAAVLNIKMQPSPLPPNLAILAHIDHVHLYFQLMLMVLWMALRQPTKLFLPLFLIIPVITVGGLPLAHPSCQCKLWCKL